MSTSDISRRKADHIAVAASGDADFAERSTLLEEVQLIHDALPELSLDEITLDASLLGATLRAPLVITGMTGGTPEAASINQELAKIAQQLGIAFGVGSQRAMAQDSTLTATYQVRDHAPDVFLLGNIGVVQARAMGAEAVASLASTIGANAMAVHLNVAQELIQDGGDRDFHGAIDIIGELRHSLPVPLLVKETGCGIGPRTARALREAGVIAVDVSGAGGTSWVAVEAKRAAPDSSASRLGHELWDWGIPTAVSTCAAADAGLEVVASGGLRSGLDAARALALGARCAGMAAPVLRAFRNDGPAGARRFLDEVIHSLRCVTLLCGCARSDELNGVHKHLGANLRGWLNDLGIR